MIDIGYILGMVGAGGTVSLFLVGIGIFFIYGLLAAVFSIVGVCRERSELGSVRDGKEIVTPEDVKDVFRIPWLDFEMRPKHLELRKAAIDECMRKWRESADTDKDKLPILPTLSDLHELTLYRESHRSSSSALTTSISVLLIAGICGTMLNVHSALGEGVDMLADLEQALEPARYAVRFTIILLILKGIYTALVTHYIAKLDSYTIKKIIPDQHKEIYKRVVTCYQETAEGMKTFRDSDIRRFCSDASGELAETKKHVDTSCGKHRKDIVAWKEFSFPVYESSRQVHVETASPLPEAATPEQVRAWDELNQSVTGIVQRIAHSSS